jgi:curved DNA-binding protein CbpA
MKTLYDLLGALPDDDAEGLRIAFRQAVKATHPDINTDDPDAPLKFRRIVRANAILSNAEQRATYDRLLALALRQPAPKPKRSNVANMVRKVAADVILVACLSAASIGAYTLFGHISNASAIPEKVIDVAARGPIEIAAAAPAAPLETTGWSKPHDKPDDTAAASQVIAPGTVTAETAQNAVAALTADNGSDPFVENAGPVRHVTSNDARSNWERGIFAYHDGDLPRALANFDLAIHLDPGFADAYVDRGIVLYRMQQFDRAFADIAQANRIRSADRTRPPGPHKVSPSARN